jgi:hypothetical protein
VTWPEVAAALGVIEGRYRKERLRYGPSAVERTPYEEVEPLLGQACEIYSGVPDDERDGIRRFFASTDAVRQRMVRFAGRSASRFHESGDPASLELALIATSIEDLVTDFRDVYLMLGALVQETGRRRVDPGPIFERVAAMSSTRTAGLIARAVSTR